MYAPGIVAAGPTPDVHASPRHPYTARLLRSRPRLGHLGKRELVRVQGLTSSPSDRWLMMLTSALGTVKPGARIRRRRAFEWPWKLRKRDVGRQFLNEAMVLGLIGGALGIVFRSPAPGRRRPDPGMSLF